MILPFTNLMIVQRCQLRTIKDSNFKNDLEPFLECCSFNRLDINWSKTHFMFISNKKLKLPTSISIANSELTIVDCFKLLGVVIDNSLNFHKHIIKVIKDINTKLFSIKKLFFLPTKVKIQFFKTFILSYRNYCSTLSIYFLKLVLRMLQNSYYLCTFC